MDIKEKPKKNPYYSLPNEERVRLMQDSFEQFDCRNLTKEESEAYQKALANMSEPTGVNLFDDYDSINISEFETVDGHLNLDNALDEIKMLYKIYGLEKDEKLTKDAQLLKVKVLNFISEIKAL